MTQTERKRCYIFDLDGTIADGTHRVHHIHKAEGKSPDWDTYLSLCGDDAPIAAIVLIAHLQSRHAPIVYMSGRMDTVKAQTEGWLKEHGLPEGALYMRKGGDYRPDYIVKKELLEQLREDGFEPIIVFDDRQQVVDMWRAEGIPCVQVAEGNF